MRISFKTVSIIMVFTLSVASFGCSRKDSELVLTDEVSTQEADALTDSGPDIKEDEGSSPDTAPELPQDEPEEDTELIVHVCGAVVTEGVYELPAGSRVIDAVNAAGGFAEGADASYVNLAQVLEDGVKLRIPTMDETKGLGTGDTSDLAGGDVNEAGITGGTSGGVESTGLVNINTASEAELCTIPGIGPSRAQSIISYREEHGSFAAIEDIMNVSGIKDKFFAKIKDHITI